jgi:simple sugar transport system ATP-binding protein
MRLGIGMVHQHFSAVPTMTVAENVALGNHGLYRAMEARSRVTEIAERVGFTLDPDARAGDLSIAAQQRLEIVKALARGARTLILDEPTAVLPPLDANELLAVLRHFADEGGAVVLITHKLPEALSAADDVTVLRRGRTVLAAQASATDVEALARAMIGGAPPPTLRPRPNLPGDVVLSAHELVLRDSRGAARVKGATLQVREREIVGLAGVDGAGQHELLLALAGRLAPISGTLHAPAAVGFVPEDRQRDALVLDFSLVENVALRGAGRAWGRLPWRSIRARTAALLEHYDIRVPQLDVPAAALSGGNQQKLILARELDGDPPPTALIVENPTRGLDIAGTASVHERLVAARDAGAAVVMYSSDLDEVLAIADRLIVMFDGLAHDVPLDRGAVGRAMLGLT